MNSTTTPSTATATAKTRKPSAAAQLKEAMALIATLQAKLAEPAVEAAPAPEAPALGTNTSTHAANLLGDKNFKRPILELIPADADYRSDEQVKRGVVLTQDEHKVLVKNWAMQRRAYWASVFEGEVATSEATYIAPASGKWPCDHDGFEFGPRQANRSFIAIY
jgi:hypothetical protein